MIHLIVAYFNNNTILISVTTLLHSQLQAELSKLAIMTESTTFPIPFKMISTVELVDRFQNLLEKESTTYQFLDYLSPSYQLDSLHIYGDILHQSQTVQNLSNQRILWRSKLCAWMYSVIDNNLLERELVAIAMSYMDRYLSLNCDCVDDRNVYQLVAMTSLYLSIKIFRHHGKCAGISSFVKLSKGIFEEKEFLNMERSILTTLQWRMHPPTSYAFADLLILLLPNGACSHSNRRALYDRINFLLELSVTVQFFFCRKSSYIAIAAFLVVMEHEDEPNVSDVKYHQHFRKCIDSIFGIDCRSEELLECHAAMNVVHRNAKYDLKYDVIEKKFGERSPLGSNVAASVVSP